MTRAGEMLPEVGRGERDHPQAIVGIVASERQSTTSATWPAGMPAAPRSAKLPVVPPHAQVIREAGAGG